jgi:hypothetical protein
VWLDQVLEIRHQSIITDLDNSTEKILRKIDSLERNINLGISSNICFKRFEDEIKLANIGTIYNEFNKKEWFPSDYDYDTINETNGNHSINSLLSLLKELK